MSEDKNAKTKSEKERKSCGEEKESEFVRRARLLQLNQFAFDFYTRNVLIS
jgi:hypothetical protein